MEWQCVWVFRWSTHTLFDFQIDFNVAAFFIFRWLMSTSFWIRFVARLVWIWVMFCYWRKDITINNNMTRSPKSFICVLDVFKVTNKIHSLNLFSIINYVNIFRNQRYLLRFPKYVEKTVNLFYPSLNRFILPLCLRSDIL